MYLPIYPIIYLSNSVIYQIIYHLSIKLSINYPSIPLHTYLFIHLFISPIIRNYFVSRRRYALELLVMTV